MPKDLPRRKSIRLEGFDYSSDGMYFVTICISGRHAMLWESIELNRPKIGKQIQLSAYGRIVDTAICEINTYYENVVVDQYCIMPDHIHMILIVHRNADGRKSSAPILSNVVGQMKRWVSKRIGFSMWQKSFYDRIIRDEAEYLQIWKYIEENPIKIGSFGEHM